MFEKLERYDLHVLKKFNFLILKDKKREWKILSLLLLLLNTCNSLLTLSSAKARTSSVFLL